MKNSLLSCLEVKPVEGGIHIGLRGGHEIQRGFVVTRAGELTLAFPCGTSLGVEIEDLQETLQILEGLARHVCATGTDQLGAQMLSVLSRSVPAGQDAEFRLQAVLQDRLVFTTDREERRLVRVDILRGGALTLRELEPIYQAAS